MRIENILIGIAMFFVVISVGLLIYSEQEQKYGISINETIFNDLRNKSNDHIELSDDLRERTQEGITTGEGTEADAYESNIPTIRSIFQAVPVVGNIMAKISQELGLPEVIQTTFTYILIILFGAFVLYMIARFKPQT